jgi:hypothetical protein
MYWLNRCQSVRNRDRHELTHSTANASKRFDQSLTNINIQPNATIEWSRSKVNATIHHSPVSGQNKKKLFFICKTEQLRRSCYET